MKIDGRIINIKEGKDSTIYTVTTKPKRKKHHIEVNIQSEKENIAYDLKEIKKAKAKLKKCKKLADKKENKDNIEYYEKEVIDDTKVLKKYEAELVAIKGLSLGFVTIEQQ